MYMVTYSQKFDRTLLTQTNCLRFALYEQMIPFNNQLKDSDLDKIN